MKNNHEAVLANIRSAIAACKEDAALHEVKRQLFAALNLAENVDKKRSARGARFNYYAEEAKKKNAQWMEMIRKNINLPEITNDETRNDKSAE
jgi:hypothetical protein